MLPHLDSNQKPFDYLPDYTHNCPVCGLPLDGHNWTCSSQDERDAEVYDLGAYRLGRTA